VPSPFNDILSKCEAAMKSLIDALAVSGLTVNTGIEDDELAAPYAICYADSSDEIVRGTGLLTASMAISVVSMADIDSLATHRARVATIFDGIRQSDAHETLSAAVTDFHCYEVVETGRDSGMEDRKLRNTLNVDLVVCGSDIS